MDLPHSHPISRAGWYSGSRPLYSTFAYGIITLFDAVSTNLRLVSYMLPSVLTPIVFLQLVWALALSLATTQAIVRLLSLPLGTKMFQFPKFPSHYLSNEMLVR